MRLSFKELGVSCVSNLVAMAVFYIVLRMADLVPEGLWFWAGIVVGVGGAIAGKEVVRAYRRNYVIPEGKRYDVENTLETLLKDLREQWGSPGAQARAFVMLPNREKTYRKVVFRKGYDKNDPDWDLELPLHAGLSGLAWNYRMPRAEGDLVELHEKIRERRLDKATFLMRPEEAAKVRPTMQSMLAVPAVCPGVGTEQIASVCVNSDGNLDKTWFDKVEIQKIVVRYADTIAQILGR